MVPDQGPVEQFAAAGLHPSLRERVHSRHLDPAEHDLDPGVLEYGVEQAGKLAVAVPDQEPRPAAGVLKVHDEVLRGLGHPGKAVGCGVAPRIRIRRLACSMTASTYRRAPVKVTVSKKSQASRASAWERRNLAQVVEVRSGAGSIPACWRICPHGGGGDLDAEDEQFAVDAAVAPAGEMLSSTFPRLCGAGDYVNARDGPPCHGVCESGVSGGQQDRGLHRAPHNFRWFRGLRAIG